jgi:D-alanyl-lipoteichoic acid acyltransferase DltB (MBOAT superfamily)
MLFNSLEFGFYFVVVCALYYLLPHRFRWLMLLVASCIFYMAFVPIYILILFTTIIIDYFAGLYIAKSTGQRARVLLLVSTLSTCLVLFFFKYFNFFAVNYDALARALHWNYSIEILKLALPIGLSFHTFQSLSYVIEVYRKKQQPERHFGIYALYVMFYPQLVAGPIERPQNLLHQFREVHAFDPEQVKSGLLLMAWGFFKKLVIADRLALYVNYVFANPKEFHGFTLAVGLVFFAYQIYCYQRSSLWPDRTFCCSSNGALHGEKSSDGRPNNC